MAIADIEALIPSGRDLHSIRLHWSAALFAVHKA
jgi:hypothetical protein